MLAFFIQNVQGKGIIDIGINIGVIHFYKLLNCIDLRDYPGRMSLREKWFFNWAGSCYWSGDCNYPQSLQSGNKPDYAITHRD